MRGFSRYGGIPEHSNFNGETHCFPPLDFGPYSWANPLWADFGGRIHWGDHRTYFDVATVAVGTLRCILEPQKWDWPATKWGFNNILRILCTHVGHILGCAAQLVSGLEPTPLRLLKIFHIYLDNFIDCPLTGMQPKVFLIFVSYTPILSILVCEPPSTRMIAQALPGPSLPGT